jgi:hypothetical protein
MKRKGRLTNRRHLIAAFFVIVVVTAGLAGKASAYAGYSAAATVGCSQNSRVLTLMASADSLDGISVQRIAATFYFQNLDTGQAYQSPWLYFQNTYVRDGALSGHSEPGGVSQDYTVPAGHYVVYVTYSWLTSSGWTQPANWRKTGIYSYKPNFLPVQYISNSCPVGVAA